MRGDEGDAKIHHIGARGPGHQQAARLLKERIRIVPLQEVLRSQPSLSGLLNDLSIDKRSGGVGGTIFAIRSSGKQNHPGCTIGKPVLGRSECQFLIASPFLRVRCRSNMHNRFPAADDASRPVGVLAAQLKAFLGKLMAHLPGDAWFIGRGSDNLNALHLCL